MPKNKTSLAPRRALSLPMLFGSAAAIAFVFFSFSGVEINISKEQLKEGISKKIPLTKEVQYKIPGLGEKVGVLTISSVETELRKDSIGIVLEGQFSTLDKILPFIVKTDGNVKYEMMKESFFYSPDSLDVELNLSSMDFQKIALEQANSANPLNEKATKSAFSSGMKMFGKLKPELQDSISGVAKRKFDTLDADIKSALGSLSKSAALAYFDSTPVYKLKDDKIQGAVSALLEKVTIQEDGIVATLSLKKIGTILLSVLIAVAAIFFFGGMILAFGGGVVVGAGLGE